jgi:hypothetical protein
MNILLNTALVVSSGPLVSAAVADRVLNPPAARADGIVVGSGIAVKGSISPAAKPLSVRI